MGTRYIVRFGGDYGNAGSATGTLIRAPINHASFPYPQVVGGLTLGPTVDNLGTGDAGGWVSGNDEALRGFWVRPNSEAPLPFRVDMPEGPGDYRLWSIFSFASFSNYALRLRDGVGGPSRWYREFNDNVMSGSAQFVVNDETSGRAMDADALDPEPTPVVRPFDSGVMEILNGGHSDGTFFSRVSAIVFEKVDAAPPAGLPPAVLRRRRTTVYL